MTLPYGTVSEIAYVVRDLEKSVCSWAETTGAGPFFEIVAAPQDVVYRGRPAQDTFKAVLGFFGSTLVEFIEPTSRGDSLWRELLGTKDEVLHHVYPNMRPLTAVAYDEAVAAYERDGLQVVWSSVVPPYSRNCMLDARDRIGCFIELLQFGEEDWGFLMAIHREHLNWDRQRPLREAAELFA